MLPTNPGREIAEKNGYGHGLCALLCAVDPGSISYQSNGKRVRNHVPGFAMLSLTPVTDLECVLVT
jgi:hypothetical protein